MNPISKIYGVNPIEKVAEIQDTVENA